MLGSLHHLGLGFFVFVSFFLNYKFRLHVEPLWSSLFFKNLFYLKGRRTQEEGDRDRPSSASLPNGHSVWGWAGVKPGARNSIGVSHVVGGGAQALGPFPLSPVRKQGGQDFNGCCGWCGVACHAGAAAASLARCAVAPTPGHLFLVLEMVSVPSK